LVDDGVKDVRSSGKCNVEEGTDELVKLERGMLQGSPLDDM
jgi:hypothetical protein